MSAPRTPPRAEVVGSLLRPPRLKQAVEAFYEAGHSAVLEEERAKDRSALRAVEDEAIREVVRRQIDLGLDVVSDGEYRRWMFMNSFYDAVSGVRTGKTVRFRNDRGDEVKLNVHEIVGRLRAVSSPGADEAAFLTSVADGHPFKVTFPAASIFAHPFTTVAGPDGGGYDSADEFLAHAIEIERSLVADAVAAGAAYIQFDFPLYPYLVDPAWIARFAEGGHAVDDLVERALAADREVLHGIPAGVRTGLHICRGNFRSSWMCEGSLEPVAERVFGELPYDSFLVEWDDLGRDGGFEPIRFVRDGSIMVLGIISTKTAELEHEDDLLRRMYEAAGIAGGLDRLAISPQCGFASVMVGNETDEDAQWRKLELVARVADRLWP
jgi:methionine synthase II (cobalamin-independent)